MTPERVGDHASRAPRPGRTTRNRRGGAASALRGSGANFPRTRARARERWRGSKRGARSTPAPHRARATSRFPPKPGKRAGSRLRRGPSRRDRFGPDDIEWVRERWEESRAGQTRSRRARGSGREEPPPGWGYFRYRPRAARRPRRRRLRRHALRDPSEQPRFAGTGEGRFRRPEGRTWRWQRGVELRRPARLSSEQSSRSSRPRGAPTTSSRS